MSCSENTLQFQHTTATEKWLHRIMFANKLKAVMWLVTVGREVHRILHQKNSSYKLGDSVQKSGMRCDPMYVEIAALGNSDTTWDTMSKAMGTTRLRVSGRL